MLRVEDFTNKINNTSQVDTFYDNNVFSFHDFFSRYLTYFECSLENIFRKYLMYDYEVIVKSNSQDMLQRLYALTIRTLVLEIYQKRHNNELEGENPNARYLSFCRQFQDDEYFSGFCCKYPCLTEKIERTLTSTLKLFEEALQGYVNDKQDIDNMLGIEGGKLVNISATSGDCHNGGKRVLLFETEDKKSAGLCKFLYKPRGLSTDIILEAAYGYVNQGLVLDLRMPRFIDRKTYGWQEFIINKSCLSIEQLERYYYRYGAMLAVAYCLNMTDLHAENIINQEEHPFIVDTETIIMNKKYTFRAEQKETSDDKTIRDLFNKASSESVLNTILIPANYLDGLFDFDMSPLAAQYLQKSEKIKGFKVYDEFTDTIHLEEEAAIFGEGLKEQGAETNIADIDAYTYLKEILDGFTECYRFILTVKQEFLDFITDVMKKNHLTVRQVMRPTYVYGKFLDASSHPDYLSDTDEQVRLLSKIKSTMYANNDKLLAQADMEIKSLLDGDIPYFFEEAESTALSSIYGKIEDFYSATILDVVKDRINKMNEEDLISQQRLIRLSIGTLPQNNWKRQDKKSLPDIASYVPYFLKDVQDMDLAVEIGDYLCHEAVWDANHEYCIWISHALTEPKVKIHWLEYALYDGGGTVLFLHHLTRMTGDERYRKTADGALKGFDDNYSQEYRKPLVLSAYYGVGSLLYIYYSLYKLWGGREYYDRYQQIFDDIAVAEFPEDMPVDFLAGAAGMAVLFINLYQEEKDDRLIRLAEKYISYCIDHYEDIKLVGLAHGYSGVLLAVAGYYRMSHDETYYHLAKKIMCDENRYYDPERNNWRDLRDGADKSDPVYWCHGAAGIGLARLKAREYLNDGIDGDDRNPCELDWKKCLAKIQSDMSNLFDHSLCHGMFGNIDCLISVYRATEDESVKDILESHYKLVFKDIQKKYAICGLSNVYDMFSFMLGLPGMAYTIMRKSNINMPSLLLLEL